MRLAELQQEIDSLHAAFPTLNGSAMPVKRRGRPAKEAAETPSTRKGWSAAARQAVGERMKAYLAEAQGRHINVRGSARSSGIGIPVEKVAQAVGKRTMSAEGRVRIAAAQKKRWARAKRGKKR